ncbi:MAG: hypothetical protein H7062_06315 [Candidatus Saccharimonas sp.]|nr:hypothetical protein [Planctomycetaceae bacterium]
MPQNTAFRSVLDEAEQLTLDEQETLLEILRHRLAEHRRKQIAEDVLAARAEFLRGECLPTTAAELMAELQP